MTRARRPLSPTEKSLLRRLLPALAMGDGSPLRDLHETRTAMYERPRGDGFEARADPERPGWIVIEGTPANLSIAVDPNGGWSARVRDNGLTPPEDERTIKETISKMGGRQV